MEIPDGCHELKEERNFVRDAELRDRRDEQLSGMQKQTRQFRLGKHRVDNTATYVTTDRTLSRHNLSPSLGQGLNRRPRESQVRRKHMHWPAQRNVVYRNDVTISPKKKRLEHASKADLSKRSDGNVHFSHGKCGNEGGRADALTDYGWSKSRAWTFD